jgi:hypothetical protein
MDDAKINSGFLDGLYKSKKLGLTTSFVATCLGILPTVANQVLQIALLGAAALTVIGYLISQGIVEAAWGRAADDLEEDPVDVPTITPAPATTTTMAAK